METGRAGGVCKLVMPKTIGDTVKGKVTWSERTAVEYSVEDTVFNTLPFVNIEKKR